MLERAHTCNQFSQNCNTSQNYGGLTPFTGGILFYIAVETPRMGSGVGFEFISENE